MPKRLLIGLSIIAFAAACGGGDSSTGINTNTGQSMTASIDGSAFSTSFVGVSTSGGVVILAGSNGTQTIGLSFAPTTGTQAVAATTVVSGSLTIGAQTWRAGPATSTPGGSGSITVTTASANHYAGTFSFTLVGIVAGTNPASRAVTSGTFDVKF